MRTYESHEALPLVVSTPDRCGNAPRKAILRDVMIALYSGNTNAVLSQIGDAATWTPIDRTLRGGREDRENQRDSKLHGAPMMPHQSGQLWAARDSNPRPSGCKPDALTN